jgi:hypothetical protein
VDGSDGVGDSSWAILVGGEDGGVDEGSLGSEYVWASTTDEVSEFKRHDDTSEDQVVVTWSAVEASFGR